MRKKRDLFRIKYKNFHENRAEDWQFEYILIILYFVLYFFV